MYQHRATDEGLSEELGQLWSNGRWLEDEVVLSLATGLPYQKAGFKLAIMLEQNGDPSLLWVEPSWIVRA